MPDVTSVRATDEQLFRAVITLGTLQAWEMLYDRFSEPIGGYAYKILSVGQCYDPPDHVSDVKQEAWQRVIRSVHQCTGSPVGWLYRITRNVSLDHLRKCRRLLRYIEPWPDSPAAEETLLASRPRLYSHEELYLRRFALNQALSSLSNEERTILQLRCEGLDYDEISNIAGISAVNARKIFQRAKRRISAVTREDG